MDMVSFAAAVLQIVWINILLSGDNAVVIALASRSLPPKQRRQAVIAGSAVAIGLRILVAFIVSYLLDLPFLKVAGGLLLLWIAARLILQGDEEPHDGIVPAESLWRAVRIIAVADAVMSLDNVLAVAAAAGGRSELFIFGLILSIPLVVAGSQLIVSVIERLPILVWVGGALLGWVAGEMIIGDRFLHELLRPALADNGYIANPEVAEEWLTYLAAALGAALVVVASYVIKRRRVAAP